MQCRVCAVLVSLLCALAWLCAVSRWPQPLLLLGVGGGNERLLRQLPRPQPLTACYHDNVLTALRFPNGTKSEAYVTLKKPINVTEFFSPACASALTGALDDARRSSRLPSNQHCFTRTQSPSADISVYAAVDRVVAAFAEAKLELLMVDGSLLGSLRHFGLIPWDDDLDFLVRIDQKPEVRRLLTRMSSADDSFLFIDTERVNQHWKLGLDCRLRSGSRTCQTVADFFFGQPDGAWYFRTEWPHYFPVQHVYPIRLRPFGSNSLVPTPNLPLEFLHRQYRTPVMLSCEFSTHSDRHRACGMRQQPCSILSWQHQFVTSVLLPGNRTVELLLWRQLLLAAFAPAASD